MKLYYRASFVKYRNWKDFRIDGVYLSIFKNRELYIGFQFFFIKLKFTYYTAGSSPLVVRV